jgi:hypothetical protein
MDGADTNIPLFWQWFGLVLAIFSSIVGLVAIPAILQVIWGRPRLKVSYIQEGDNDWKTLKLVVRNSPPTFLLLRIMNVQRSPAYLTSFVVIRNAGTGQVICRDPLLDNPEPVSVLYPSIVGRGHVVLTAAAAKPGPLVVLAGSAHGSSVLIGPGSYEASVVLLREEEMKFASKRFVVGTKPELIHWLE